MTSKLNTADLEEPTSKNKPGMLKTLVPVMWDLLVLLLFVFSFIFVFILIEFWTGLKQQIFRTDAMSSWCCFLLTLASGRALVSEQAAIRVCVSSVTVSMAHRK